MGGLIVTVPPAVEPVTLAQAKAHLRVDFDDDDDIISSFIQAARERVEDIAYVSLITQTLLLTLDSFPWGWASSAYQGAWPFWGAAAHWPVIEMKPPVLSVTSVQYVDPSGATQIMPSANYRLDTTSTPCRLIPAQNVVWPATAPVTAAVSVTFQGGYGATGAAVPQRFLEAIRLLVGHYYLNREEILSGTRIVAIQIPEGVTALISRDSPPLVA